MATDGKGRKSEEAQRVIGGLTGQPYSGKIHIYGKERLLFHRGETSHTDEYAIDELFVGPLSSECVDLRGTLKLALSLEENRESEKIPKCES